MPALLRFAQFLAALAFVAILSLVPPILNAQSTPPSPAQQQAQPDSDGPNDQSPIVVPKIAVPKKETPIPASPEADLTQNLPSPPLAVELQEVTIDVGVLLEKTHSFLPGLKPANFHLYEDGIEQKILGFSHNQTPITALILCESPSAGSRDIVNDILSQASNVTTQLRPEDYAALMTFASQTQLVTDLTQDKSEIAQALHQLHAPDSASGPASSPSEHNLYDALYDRLDRLSHIAGEKYILLIASGRDTSSKTTLATLLDKIRNTPDTTIFTISSNIAESTNIAETQANAPMQLFAQMTGGLSFTPHSLAETPNSFKTINEAIRSQYELAYRPTNTKQDGTYRRIQVELVDDQGYPLKLEDEKHKPLKYSLVVREGYRANEIVK